MLRRQLLALFWHEPLSVAMVKSRRVFSWAKNIMPALNKALPPALKRRVLREHADDALPRGLAPLAAFETHSRRVSRIRDMLPGVTVRKLAKREFKFDPGRYNAPPGVDEGYDGALVDGERIVVDDETTLRVWHTPGHCEDHACFLLEEERAIFSGDNVLGAGSSWFEDLATYMRTLNDMLRLAEGEKLVALYPGHGPPSADPAAKIREFVDHRGAREGQVRAALDDAGRTSLASSSPSTRSCRPT
ncbi:hydroxyacylglutathione hydrolase [Aureococcus anophagefferens]|nr:hydroxyacylglutathione hydrolase [Aureococcus anophagefferens]